MARKGDYQVIQMSTDTPFTLYQWSDRAWHYRGRLATEKEVQTFVDTYSLTYLSSGTPGSWPTRTYRSAKTK